MKITVVAVGKIKEKYYEMAVAEYAKRLSRYCKLEIVEVADEKTPVSAAEATEELIKEREAQRVLRCVKENSYLIALEISGRNLSSESFAKRMEELATSGISHLTFVIGGSIGLHGSILDKADLKLSFSEMTYPHQLMRVILLEQIYRGFKIINHEPYHK